MILAGDVGGTKTVLALFEAGDRTLHPSADAVYPSREHASLEEILERFLAERGEATVETACLGVAGAVISGRARVTNLAWKPVDERGLAAQLGARRVLLLNDLQATAYGMLELSAGDLAPLNAGAEPRSGNAAVIAAGTGLGQAMLYWDGARHHAIASEAGHADFAPRSEREVELWRFVRAELGRASVEHVLSGPGLQRIYRFLRAGGAAPEPDWLAADLRDGDAAAAIAEAGLAGRDRVCAEALELFASLYGAEAGNLAIRCLAVGGVFLGGGIAPKILPALRGGVFLRAFTDKGHCAELLAATPVQVSLDPRAALRGAARCAARIRDAGG